MSIPDIEIPAPVRRKAKVLGVADWPDEVPGLLEQLAAQWGLSFGEVFGEVFDGATQALVVAATRADGTATVLKLAVPQPNDRFEREARVLELAQGRGCARLLEFDSERNALLKDRLGATLASFDLPMRRRHDLLCDAAARVWRATPPDLFPSGADRARADMEHIASAWEATGRPCSERVLTHAVACAENRIAAHDENRAVLVHGDVHQWNALQDGDGFALVDPDGLYAEPEFDLGGIMRLDPDPQDRDEPLERARHLAERSGLDERAIWEWGVVARVATGLLLVSLEMDDGLRMLAVAEQIASSPPP